MNYGFPYVYQNPFMQMIQPTPQPQITQPASSVPPIPETTNIVGVNGIEGMKAFQTSPNSRIVGFDLNNDVFYIKTTDASNTATIKTYSFAEVMDKAEDETRYVTMKEFNKFKEDLLSGKQYIRKPKHNSGSTSKSYKPDSRGYEHASEPSEVYTGGSPVTSEVSGSDGADS